MLLYQIRKEKSKYIFLFFLRISCFSLTAQISMPSVFCDNMVLQQNADVSIWGYGNRDEIIKIVGSWAPKDTIFAKADVLGKFSTKIRTSEFGGPYTLSIIGSRRIIYKNILLGEVWLCSGQSNMAMPLSGTENAKENIVKATNPRIRIFSVSTKGAGTPQNNCDGVWNICSPDVAGRTSAVAYYFAEKLYMELKVPIGIIVSAVGGTPAEAWTPEEIVFSDSIISNNLCRELWNTRPSKPGVLYNWMIHPVIPYTISGCIWYQGESNYLHYQTYSQLLDKMVTSWRKRFNSEFPFYVVQIAPYQYYSTDNAPALLREQQELFTKHVKHTGLVTISDLVNDIGDIHPIRKKEVGVRLANWALGDHYCLPVKGYKTPILDNIFFRKGKAIVRFRDLEKLKATSFKELEIASWDGRFYDAEGCIKDNELILWSEKVRAPAYVRYCFNDDGEACLFNETDLPVAPFRTDSFKK